MSELSITPNFDKKTAKIKGTIAAGEHIAVTLNDCGTLSTDNLRFRFITPEETLAIFPLEESDAFTVNGTTLTFTLNANTTAMLKAVKDGAVRTVLAILDDPSDDVRKMYFTEPYYIQKWALVGGADTPVDLDDYPSLLETFTEDLATLKEQFEDLKVEHNEIGTELDALSDTVGEWDDHIKTAEANSTNNTNLINELKETVDINTASIASKQDALSESQLAAVNSGITSAKITEIDTKISTNASDISTNASSISGLRNYYNELKGSLESASLYSKNALENSDWAYRFATTAKETADNALSVAESKQDALTFDITPTSGSTNPITSEGIYEAVQSRTPVDVDDYHWFEDSQEWECIALISKAYTTNDDGTVSVTNNELWSYTIEDGEGIVTLSDTADGDIVVPDRVQDTDLEWYKVTAIASRADTSVEQTTVTSISGGKYLKTIATEAFRNCTALTSLSLPTATNVSGYMCYGCTALETASIPNAEIIDEYAFNTCKKLVSVDAPKATSIGALAFQACNVLESAIFPEATSIGEGAFLYCYALVDTDFSNVTTVSASAFMSCSSPVSISLPKATSVAGVALFRSCTALESVSLPSMETLSGTSMMFTSCTSINELEFGPYVDIPAAALSASQSNAITLRCANDSYSQWKEWADARNADGYNITVIAPAYLADVATPLSGVDASDMTLGELLVALGATISEGE